MLFLLMKYRIEYYNEAVQTTILLLPSSLLARYLHLTKRMMEHGANLGMPHSRPMKDGLFELRLKGTDGIGRVFYCTLTGKKIVVLHSFVKKTNKTPHKELALARKRMKEVKNNAIP